MADCLSLVVPFQQCGPSRGASLAKSYICLSCTFSSVCHPFHVSLFIALRGLTAWLVSSFLLFSVALCFPCTWRLKWHSVVLHSQAVMMIHERSSTTIVNKIFEIVVIKVITFSAANIFFITNESIVLVVRQYETSKSVSQSLFYLLL